MRLRGTLRSRPLSVTILGSDAWWWRSWPRRRLGPLTSRWSWPRWTGYPNALGRPQPSGRWGRGPGSARWPATARWRTAGPGVGRAAGPGRGPRRAGPFAPALRGVAAPAGPPRGRTGAAAHRPRHAGRDGHDGVRRAGPPRAGGHRQDRP